MEEKLKFNGLVRFAFSTYSYKTNTFKFSSFDNHILKNEKVNSVMNIRNEVLNFDWDSSCIHLVLNITTHLDRKNREKFQDFMYYEDETRKLLDHKEIFFIESEKSLWDATSQVNLNELVLQARTKSFNEKLAFLKRHNFDSIQQAIQSLNKKYFPNKNQALNKELNDFKKIKCLFFTKNSLKESFCFKEDQSINVKMITEYVVQAKNLFLSIGQPKKEIFKFEQKSFIWFEIFENQRVFIKIMEIYLTAKNIVDGYNKIMGKIFKMIKVFKIDHEKYPICAIETDLPLTNSKICFPNISLLKQLESLTHFSYEYSDNQLILVDLRPILISNQRILLTEPVIHSFYGDSYGSSDLGIMALQKFKSEHECNEYCNKLNLTKL